MASAIGSAVSIVVQQYAAETAHLRRTRHILVRAPHVRMLHLSRLDARIDAHLDGLRVSGAAARDMCVAALAEPGPGELFAAASWALDAGDMPLFERLVALAEALPESESGLFSALGWSSTSTLRGLVKTSLAAPGPFRRQVGLKACALHRVDAGAALTSAIADPDARLRACAIKTAGQCARMDLLPMCLQALQDDDPECRAQAAVAALLLGDRSRALAASQAGDDAPRPEQMSAWCLSLAAVATTTAHDVLKRRAGDLSARRAVIRGIGVTGDPHYVPWLLDQIKDPQWARLAGESFELISGVDLVEMGFETERPDEHEQVPNDDSADDRVALDEDEDLPWPDRSGLVAWWQEHERRFPPGTRYFLGVPVGRGRCVEVLKVGGQRQRILAAHHLCLLEPGTPLFNTSSPAWQQQRLLAQMS